MALYLRDLPGRTLRTLADEVNIDDSLWGGVTTEMDVRIEDDRMYFTFGTEQVPATADGMEQLASFVDVPRNYLARIEPDMQQFNLSHMLRRNPANVAVRYTEDGIHEVYKPDRVRLEPRQIVDKAIGVMGEEAELVESVVDSDELFFDVMVPEDFDRAVGGDLQTGDITRGGLRFSQDRKHNHAPQVNTFLFRLLCTNGLVVPETGLTLDARGSTVDSLLAELEMAAERAFSQVEEELEHFYGLRQQRVEGDVTQTVLRVAQEQGLPDRTAMALSRRVPDQLNPEILGHEVSMFDVVNLITNQANHPDIRNRRNSRRALESAGGNLVRSVADRCGTCHQQIA